MRIFIAHSLGMTDKAIKYAEEWEEKANRHVHGIFKKHRCYIPGRDTDQTKPYLEILKANKEAIIGSEEVHIIWDLSSLGTIMDVGMAFALDKPIKIIDTKNFHITKLIDSSKGEYLVSSSFYSGKTKEA